MLRYKGLRVESLLKGTRSMHTRQCKHISLRPLSTKAVTTLPAMLLQTVNGVALITSQWLAPIAKGATICSR